MRREKIEELVQLCVGSAETVRGLGWNLGFALGNRGDRDVAQAYADAIGVRQSVSEATAAAFIQGYLAAVRDVSTSYVDGQEEQVATDPVALAAWVESREGGTAILQLAYERAAIRPDDVSEKLGGNGVQWESVLLEMCERRLLQHLPGGHLRGLTLTGQRVLGVLYFRALG